MSEPTGDELEDLDEGLRGLLARHGDGATPPDGVRDRVLARVQDSIALGSPLASEGNAPEPRTNAPDAPGEVVTEVAEATTSGLGSTTLGSTWGKVVTSGLFALGVGTGAAGHAFLRSPEVPRAVPASSLVEHVAPPQAPRPANPPPDARPEPTTPPEDAVEVPADAVPPAGVPPAGVLREGPRAGAPPTLPEPATPSSEADKRSKDAQLAEENLLIGRAQTALGRREPRAALQALDLHEARFKSGQLAFERDLLRRETLKMLSAEESSVREDAP